MVNIKIKYKSNKVDEVTRNFIESFSNALVQIPRIQEMINNKEPYAKLAKTSWNIVMPENEKDKKGLTYPPSMTREWPKVGSIVVTRDK